MKKIDLGQAIGILANLGVIGGIVFLGIELRQNNDLMGQQQRFNRLSLIIGTSTLIAENADLAAVWAKVVAQDYSQLTPAERAQATALESRVLRAQEWSFRELPRQELPTNLWRRNSRRESWRSLWNEIRDDLDPEFVEFMEEEVINR